LLFYLLHVKVLWSVNLFSIKTNISSTVALREVSVKFVERFVHIGGGVEYGNHHQGITRKNSEKVLHFWGLNSIWSGLFSYSLGL